MISFVFGFLLTGESVSPAQNAYGRWQLKTHADLHLQIFPSIRRTTARHSWAFGQRAAAVLARELTKLTETVLDGAPGGSCMAGIADADQQRKETSS